MLLQIRSAMIQSPRPQGLVTVTIRRGTVCRVNEEVGLLMAAFPTAPLALMSEWEEIWSTCHQVSVLSLSSPQICTPTTWSWRDSDSVVHDVMSNPTGLWLLYMILMLS